MFNKKKGNAEKDELDLEFMEESGNADIQDFEDEGKELKPKKKKLPGWVIIPIIAGICVIAIVAAVFSGGKKDTGAKALQAQKIEKGDVKEVYTTTGTVESEVTKTFYSPVTAPVASCNAKVGTAVKAGDMLITFDTKELEKNNTESQLQLQSTYASNQSTIEQTNQSAQQAAEAQQQAEEARAAQISDLQQQVYNAQDQAAQAWAAAEAADAEAQTQNAEVSAKIAEIQPQLTEAQAKLDELNVTYETFINEQNNFEEYNQDKTDEDKKIREKELADFVVAYPKNKLDLETQVKTLQAELANAGEIADVSGLYAAAEAADQQVAALQAQLDQASSASASSSSTTPSLTSGQKKSMEIAENLAELSALSIEELVQKGRDGIQAEFDGVISDVQVAAGTQAAQGSPLFTIASNQSVAVNLEIPSSDFEKVVVGGKGTIKIGQNSYNGTITKVNKIAVNNAKGNPVIGATLHIDDPNDQIIIGVSAKATINVAEAKDVLYLSNEVVNTGTDGDFVYVIENGTVKKKSVELGIASNSTVEIKAGLKEGDVVITDTSSDLKDGTKATAVLSDNK